MNHIANCGNMPVTFGVKRKKTKRKTIAGLHFVESAQRAKSNEKFNSAHKYGFK